MAIGDVIGGQSPFANATSFDGSKSYVSPTKKPGYSPLQAAMASTTPGAGQVTQGAASVARPARGAVEPSAPGASALGLQAGGESQIGVDTPAAAQTSGQQAGGGSQITVSPDGGVQITTSPIGAAIGAAKPGRIPESSMGTVHPTTPPDPAALNAALAAIGDTGIDYAPAVQQRLAGAYTKWGASGTKQGFVEWLKTADPNAALLAGLTTYAPPEQSIDPTVRQELQSDLGNMFTQAPANTQERLAIAYAKWSSAGTGGGFKDWLKTNDTALAQAVGLLPTYVPVTDGEDGEEPPTSFLDDPEWQAWIGQVEKAAGLRMDAALARTAQMYDAAKRRNAAMGGRGFAAAYSAGQRALTTDQLRESANIVNSIETQLADQIGQAMFAEHATTNEDRKWLMEFKERRRQFDTTTGAQISQWAEDNNIAWARVGMDERLVSGQLAGMVSTGKLNDAQSTAILNGLKALSERTDLDAEMAKTERDRIIKEGLLIDQNILNAKAQVTAINAQVAGQEAETANIKQQTLAIIGNERRTTAMVNAQIAAIRASTALTDVQKRTLENALLPLKDRADLEAVLAQATVAGREAETAKIVEETRQLVANSDATKEMLAAQIAAVKASTDLSVAQKNILVNDLVAADQRVDLAAVIARDASDREDSRMQLLRDELDFTRQSWMAGQEVDLDEVDAVVDAWADANLIDPVTGLVDTKSRDAIKAIVRRNVINTQSQLNLQERALALQEYVTGFQATMTTLDFFATNVPEMAGYLIEGFVSNLGGFLPYARIPKKDANGQVMKDENGQVIYEENMMNATQGRLKEAMPEIVATFYMDYYGDSITDAAQLETKLDRLLSRYNVDQTDGKGNVIQSWADFKKQIIDTHKQAWQSKKDAAASTTTGTTTVGPLGYKIDSGGFAAEPITVGAASVSVYTLRDARVTFGEKWTSGVESLFVEWLRNTVTTFGSLTSSNAKSELQSKVRTWLERKGIGANDGQRTDFSALVLGDLIKTPSQTTTNNTGTTPGTSSTGAQASTGGSDAYDAST